MTITFQVQIEPDEDVQKLNLELLKGNMYDFVSKCEKLGYTRCQMYVDQLDIDCWLKENTK